jgi:hypothetical protein
MREWFDDDDRLCVADERVVPASSSLEHTVEWLYRVALAESP